MKRRLQKDEKLLQEYKKTVNQYINQGFAVKLTREEMKSDSLQKKWYLPHHPVIHPQKQKVRVVFDCAANYRGTSLNDQLLQGPNQTNSIVGVLSRFRQGLVALVADVEAMFHQVKVKPEDTGALRFFMVDEWRLK